MWCFSLVSCCFLYRRRVCFGSWCASEFKELHQSKPGNIKKIKSAYIWNSLLVGFKRTTKKLGFFSVRRIVELRGGVHQLSCWRDGGVGEDGRGVLLLNFHKRKLFSQYWTLVTWTSWWPTCLGGLVPLLHKYSLLWTKAGFLQRDLIVQVGQLPSRKVGDEFKAFIRVTLGLDVSDQGLEKKQKHTAELCFTWVNICWYPGSIKKKKKKRTSFGNLMSLTFRCIAIPLMQFFNGAFYSVYCQSVSSVLCL